MKIHTMAVVALATVLVTAGAAGAVAGVGAQTTDDRSAAENAEDERAGNTSARDEQVNGPGQSLPEQVPDHVAALHDTIRQFLFGDLAGHLGAALNDVTPGGDAEPRADGGA